MTAEQTRLAGLRLLRETTAREAYDPYYTDIRIYTMLRTTHCDRCGDELPKGELAYWVGRNTYWCGCEETRYQKTAKLREHEQKAADLRSLLEGKPVEVRR